MTTLAGRLLPKPTNLVKQPAIHSTFHLPQYHWNIDTQRQGHQPHTGRQTPIPKYPAHGHLQLVTSTNTSEASPEPGRIVFVRQRRYLVEGVTPPSTLGEASLVNPILPRRRRPRRTPNSPLGA